MSTDPATVPTDLRRPGPRGRSLVRVREGGSRYAWAAQLYGYIAIVFLSGALDRPLSGNASSFVDTGPSLTIQIFGLALYVLALVPVMLGKVRVPNNIVTWSFVGLVLLAGSSALWSQDPDTVLRRTVALAGSILVGYVVVSQLPPRVLITMLVRASVALIVVTLALYLIVPAYALHQATDMGVAEHAGRLRGSFPHKNECARVVGLATILIASLGKPALRSAVIQWGSFAIGLGLVLLAGSAKIMLGLPLALAAGFVLSSQRGIAARWTVIGAIVLVCGLLYTLGEYSDIFSDMLGAVGRDASFSGRTVLWQAAWQSILGHPLFGQGYFTGWKAQAYYIVYEVWNMAPNHPHNGFLNVLVDLGVVGFMLAIVPILSLVRATVFYPRWAPRRMNTFLGAWVATFLFANTSGSYLINYNDIYTFVMIATSCWITALLSGRMADDSLAFLSR